MAEMPTTLNFQAVETPPTRVLQVAPLTDIVFLLIGFYLLVGQMVSNQKDPAVQLPTMVSPAGVPEAPAELVINVLRGGGITINGQPASLKAVRRIVQETLAESLAQGRPVRVAVRGDRREQYREILRVLSLLRDCGVKQIDIRAQEGPGS